ncbi:hypothetical protein ALC53_00887 [Atta colombica]|uniref:Uncharacterized protein n=1 Tax=Atta colombica TaxID=520822 RepID=A0A195BV23_9HYME|nr:hypothetical protein ALC53_00887 [Atta colombica]
MERLEQIKVIANNFKTGFTKAVKALFGDFAFASGSEKYKNKLTYTSWKDLVSICNILAIDYAGTKKEQD